MKSISSKIGIKTICFLGLISFCLVANESQAQTVGKGLVGSAKLIEDPEKSIISFSPVFNNGKTYVRWLVQNDEKDGIFIVERSQDGVEFEALGYKERIGSPLCVNLFYSFVDELPFNELTYYRIMQVGTDQTYTYSDIVSVKTDMTNIKPQGTTVLSE